VTNQHMYQWRLLLRNSCAPLKLLLGVFDGRLHFQGTGRQARGAQIYALTHWCLGPFLLWLLPFRLGWGVRGIWAALAIISNTQVVFMAVRFLADTLKSLVNLARLEHVRRARLHLRPQRTPVHFLRVFRMDGHPAACSSCRLSLHLCPIASNPRSLDCVLQGTVGCIDWDLEAERAAVLVGADHSSQGLDPEATCTIEDAETREPLLTDVLFGRSLSHNHSSQDHSSSGNVN
jgi:hypothetical protein